MKAPLRILYIEDEPRDAELVQGTLEAGGIDCDFTRVETQAELVAALEQGGFDLVLADYTLPSFDGLSALKVAQQGWPWRSAPPAELPEPGPSTNFDLIVHHVSDLDRAVRLFSEVLDGQIETIDARTVELSWPRGRVIRLVQEDALPRGGSLHHVRFARPAAAFSDQERERAGLLAKDLGLTVELAN